MILEGSCSARSEPTSTSKHSLKMTGETPEKDPLPSDLKKKDKTKKRETPLPPEAPGGPRSSSIFSLNFLFQREKKLASIQPRTGHQKCPNFHFREGWAWRLNDCRDGWAWHFRDGWAISLYHHSWDRKLDIRAAKARFLDSSFNKNDLHFSHWNLV